MKRFGIFAVAAVLVVGIFSTMTNTTEAAGPTTKSAIATERGHVSAFIKVTPNSDGTYHVSGAVVSNDRTGVIAICPAVETAANRCQSAPPSLSNSGFIPGRVSCISYDVAVPYVPKRVSLRHIMFWNTIFANASLSPSVNWIVNNIVHQYC